MSAAQFNPFATPVKGRHSWDGKSKLFIRSLRNKPNADRTGFVDKNGNWWPSAIMFATFTKDGTFCGYSGAEKLSASILVHKAVHLFESVFPYTGYFDGGHTISANQELYQEVVEWVKETRDARNWTLIDYITRSYDYERIDQAESDIVLIGGEMVAIWFRSETDAVEFKLKFGNRNAIIKTTAFHEHITNVAA